MAQLAFLGPALGAVGGFIGTYGGAILSVASVAASFLLKPSSSAPAVQDQFTQGPRLGELSVTTSSYGKDRPIVFGTMRLGGNIVWATDIEEREVVTVTDIDAGGGGGGGWFGKGGGGGGDSPTLTNTSYVYYGNFAIDFAEGIAHDKGLIRVWADGKLIWDRREGKSSTKKYSEMDIRFYPGNKTQNPDSFIEADKGAGNVPGYRDVCYAVIENMPLADFANRPPNFTAEISFNAADAYPVTDIGDLGSALTGVFWDRIRSVLFTQDSTNISRIDLGENAITTQRAILDLDDFYAGGWGMDQALHVTPEGNPVVRYNDPPRNYDRIFQLNLFSLETVQYVTRDASWLANFGSLDATRVNAVNTPGMGRHVVLVGQWGIGNINLDADGFGRMDAQDFTTFDASVPVGSVVQTDRDGKVWVAGNHSGPSVNECFLWDINIESTVPTVSRINIDGFRDLAAYQHIPRGMAYDPATHSLIIASESGFSGMKASVLRWDIETETVVWQTDSDAATLGNFVVGVWSLTLMKYGPNGGYVYTADSSNAIVYKIRISDGSIVAEYDLSVFSEGTSFNFPIYDDSTHTIVAQRAQAGATQWHLLRLWLDRADTSGVPLEDVVADLATRTDLVASDLELTQLVSAGHLVRGYMVTKQSTIRSALQPLGYAYFFDAIESDHLVKFVTRGGSSVATIVEDDLGARASATQSARAERFIEELGMEAELPRKVEISFYDPEHDYQQAHEHDSRISFPDTFSTQGSKDTRSAELAMALLTSEGRAIVETVLYQMWLNKKGYTFQALPKHQLLEPTDIATVINRGVAFTVRLLKTNLGAGYLCDMAGVSEDAEIYEFSGLGTYGGRGQLVDGEIVVYGQSYPFLMDIPLLRDVDDSGLFAGMLYITVGATSDNWRGAIIHKSEDQWAWDQILNVTRDAAWGTSVEPAGGGGLDLSLDPFIRWETWDRTSQLRVLMAQGESLLASVTELEALNGANTALLGSEIIRFVNVSGPDGNGVYTLDTLIRGRRGTGQHAEAGHPRGSRFLLLTTTNTRKVTMPLTDIGNVRFFRAITIGSPYDDAGVYNLSYTAACLKPYFVAHLEGSRDGSDNVDLTWVRRSRLSGDLDWEDQEGDIPLGETSEAYEVDYFEAYLAALCDAASTTTTIRDVGAFTGLTDEDLAGRPVSIQHQDDYLTEEYSVVISRQDNNVINIDPPWDTAPAAGVPYSIQNLVADHTDSETSEASQYSAGEQTSVGDVIYATVYQMSSVVGRGFPRSIWVW